MNFLQSSHDIAPYFFGCLRVVIELQTSHAGDFVNIDDVKLDDVEFGELSLSENGLLIKLESLSCDPNRLKLVESCSTGFLRIDEERLLFDSLLSDDNIESEGAVAVDDVAIDNDEDRVD